MSPATICPYVVPTPANTDSDGKGIHLYGVRFQIKGPGAADWINVIDVPYEVLGVDNIVMVPIPSDGTWLIRYMVGEFGIVVAADPSGKQKDVMINWSDACDPISVFVKVGQPTKPVTGTVIEGN